MFILFFSFDVSTPIFEADLDIISDHLEKGDEVFVLGCEGQLKKCFHNLNHEIGECIACKSKFKKGIDLLNLSSKNINFLPKLNLDYSNLPQKFSNIKELIGYKIDDHPIGMGVASTLVTRYYKDHRLDTLKYKKEIYEELKLAYYLYKTLLIHLEKVKPDLVYIFNGRLAQYKSVICACKNMGINFVIHELAGQKGKYSLRYNTTNHDIKYVTNEINKFWDNNKDDKYTKATQWFEDRRKGVDQALKSFTSYQKIGLLPKGFDKSKRNIAIFNSTIEEYVAIEGWENHLYVPDETAGIKAILDDFKYNENVMFYLRIHPHMKNLLNTHNSQLNDIKILDSQYNNLKVIWPEDIIHTYTLLDECEKIITFGSTVGVEATYWGKPSILAGRALYENLDCCYKPRSHKELIELLNKDLKAKDKEEALKYGYWEMTYGEHFKRFVHTGINEGLFLGKKIKASSLSQLIRNVSKIYYKPKRIIKKRLLKK
jgi:hypothetical protein